MTVTSFGETNRPAFFSLQILCEGVANLSFYESLKPSQISHSPTHTGLAQRSSPETWHIFRANQMLP